MPLIHNHDIIHSSNAVKKGKYWLMLQHELSFLEKYASENVLCVSDAWKLQEHDEIIINFLKKDKRKKVIIFSFIDPPSNYKKVLLAFPNQSLYISCKDFFFFLDLHNTYAVKYETEDLYPAKIKNIFLCYQRKYTPARERLYLDLKRLNNGLITAYGYPIDSNINKDLPAADIGLDDTLITDCNAPNDMFSLGNFTIWKESFLNIVSETDSNPNTVFLTEKTCKPIFGMRPFLIYGYAKSEKYLEKLGFKTFNKFFNFKPINDIEEQRRQLVKIINNLSNKNCNKIYKELLPACKHNYFNIERICARQKVLLNKKISNWLNT